MRIGTKSLLFGAHQIVLHPIILAISWCKLYGFPFDPRLWLCFLVHDWGYWGKPNMDGPEGEEHPVFGSDIVRKICGQKWGDFCLYHSRWYSSKHGKQFSKLCVADKYAIVITPSWLYLPMVKATGELREYMGLDRENKYKEMGFDESTPYKWHQSVKKYIKEWVELHKDANTSDKWIT